MVGTGSATRYRLPVWASAVEEFGEREQAVLTLVVARGQVGRDEVCEALGVSPRTANRVLEGGATRRLAEGSGDPLLDSLMTYPHRASRHAQGSYDGDPGTLKFTGKTPCNHGRVKVEYQLEEGQVSTPYLPLISVQTRHRHEASTSIHFNEGVGSDRDTTVANPDLDRPSSRIWESLSPRFLKRPDQSGTPDNRNVHIV